MSKLSNTVTEPYKNVSNGKTGNQRLGLSLCQIRETLWNSFCWQDIKVGLLCVGRDSNTVYAACPQSPGWQNPCDPDVPGSHSLSIQNQRFSHPAHGFPNPSQHITGFHPLLWKLSRSLAETGTVIACFDDKQNQIMSALVFD